MAYLPIAEGDSDATADVWQVRRRLQTALGNITSAFDAGVREFAALTSVGNQHDSTDSKTRRQEIAETLDQLLAMIPPFPESIDQLDGTAIALTGTRGKRGPFSRSDPAAAIRDSAGHGFPTLVNSEHASARCSPRRFLTREQRLAIVPKYLERVFRDVTVTSASSTTDESHQLVTALLQLYEQALGSGDLAVTASEMGQARLDGSSSGQGQVTLVEPDAEWHLWDQTQPPAADWRLPDFDSNEWPAGAGPFGFGDDGRGYTKMQSGQLAYYIRHEFDAQLDQLPAEAGLILRVARDDGAVVYLNGEEILRDNMPGRFHRSSDARYIQSFWRR